MTVLAFGYIGNHPKSRNGIEILKIFFFYDYLGSIEKVSGAQAVFYCVFLLIQFIMACLLWI